MAASTRVVRSSFTITITAVNDAPVAANDSWSIAEDSLLSVATSGVLSNDLDVDGDTLAAHIVTAPVHGSITLNADGSFVYTPSANYNGADSFTYVANDGLLDSAVATVSIVVTSVNDAPVAVNDTYTIAEDLSLVIGLPGLLVNDSDVDGDALTTSLVTGPSHGTLVLNADGSFSYTPSSNYNGADSFSYIASDGKLNSSTASVALTVTAVNDAPVAVNDTYSVNAGVVLTITAPGVLANDTDVDGNPLTTNVVTSPAHGTLVLGLNGSLTFNPSPGFSGTDTFTYVANDGITSSAPAVVTIQVTPVVAPPNTDHVNFFVPDSGTRKTFGYSSAGTTISSAGLNAEDKKPRGIASNDSVPCSGSLMKREWCSFMTARMCC